MASVNKAILESMYVVEMKSMPEIAAALGTNYSRIRKMLIDAGIGIRSRVEGVRLVRNKISASQRGSTRTMTEEWRENLTAALRKRADKTAAGVSLKQSGYLEYTRGPNKGRSVHVVIAETHLLGRRLKKGEHVHHKDENKTNNNLENLEVMTISEHMRIHAKANCDNRERDGNGRFC